jgi:hypothetical protein
VGKPGEGEGGREGRAEMLKVIRVVVSVVVRVVVRVVMKDVVVKHINRIGWEKHITTCIRIGNEGHVDE